MRISVTASFYLAGALALAASSASIKGAGRSRAATQGPVAPKAGIKTPGIQIPFEQLKPDAEIQVETPGWITAGDVVFVPNRSKGAVIRVEAKTNKPLDAVAGLQQPCSGVLESFGSLWVPDCAAQGVTRFDSKTSKMTATLNIGAADAEPGIAATADSIWLLVDSKATLARIDPETNQVVGELRLPAACNSLAFGENALWVTCPAETRLLRINPATNLVEKRIEVAAGARAVAFGAGSVWVLCGKEGKVARIDPKTNKVIKTLDLDVPNAGGNLAFGAGFLWVTQTGFPLTRIDPETDKEAVAQQFWGDYGGSVSATSNAIWLSNVAKGSVWRLDPKRVIATLAE
jgi:virginiamycin B lyase